MKRFLLSTVALVGFAGIASAADLPRQLPPPPPPVIVPVFTWTGFYFGVNAGAAFDAGDDEEDFFGGNVRLPRGSVINSPTTNGTLTLRDGGFDDGGDDDFGFSGGGQIGFNYQFTPGSGFVVGLEADIQYVDVGGDAADNRALGYAFTPAPGPTGSTGIAFAPPRPRVFRAGLSARDLNYFGTVRGRLGYAFDRTLIYATGGFAYGGGDVTNNNDQLFDNNGVFDDQLDDFIFGWTVGGGVEFALTNFQLFGSSTMTFKIEGLYVNLEGDNNNVRRPGLATFNPNRNTVVLHRNATPNDELEFAVIRAGVNFKF